MSGRIQVSKSSYEKPRYAGILNRIDNTHSIKTIEVTDGPSLETLLGALQFSSCEGDPTCGVEFHYRIKTENGLTGEYSRKMVPYGIKRVSDSEFLVTVYFPEVTPPYEEDIETVDGELKLNFVAEGRIDIKYDVNTRTGTVVA